jgi:hypothetical protein
MSEAVEAESGGVDSKAFRKSSMIPKSYKLAWQAPSGVTFASSLITASLSVGEYSLLSIAITSPNIPPAFSII